MVGKRPTRSGALQHATTERLRPVFTQCGPGPDEPEYGDAMVRGGRIGHLEIGRSCYSFNEMLGLAAEDMARTGTPMPSTTVD